VASETLLEKYKVLVAENETLKKENERLRAKLRDILPLQSYDAIFPAPSNDSIQPSVLLSEIPPAEKIKLFATLFRGRAIKLPKPPLGMVSWLGNNLS